MRDLREIVVISGKGGTGKTSLTAAFAALARNAVLCDLDVDVPDLHIVLDPTPRRTSEFLGAARARILAEACIGCGACADLCRFGAIALEDGLPVLDPLDCEGCGVCAALCPEKAIAFEDVVGGEWMVSDTRFGPLVHARLTPGQEASGKLVTLLKQEARALAGEEGRGLLLCDGSPGIGCPVISSLAGASLAVAVVEPTVSGRHDFERVAGVCAHFRVPVGVVINRADLAPDEAKAIEADCAARGWTLFGSVPFDAEVTRATVAGQAVTERPGPLADRIRAIWERIDAFRPSIGRSLAMPAAPAGRSRPSD